MSLPHLSRLSISDLPLIGRITGIVVAARVALTVPPYRRVTWLVRLTEPAPAALLLSKDALRYWRRVVSYASAVSRRLLGHKPCLTHTSVAHCLLRQAGQPTKPKIGVTQREAGWIRAHAWLEDRGFVVNGAWWRDLTYTPLRPLTALSAG